MKCGIATTYEFNTNIDSTLSLKKKNACFLQGTRMPPVLDPVEKPSQIETETKDLPTLATGVIVPQQPWQ